MFIEGRGLDAHGYVIDRDTMYILETLPGIKARELKSKGLDEPRGLASACLFFNLKLENRESGATGRRVLQEIMGPEYHPRYSDFTHLINHNELDFSAQQNPRWPQPGFMTAQVPWKKATRYNQHGSVTCVEDLVSLRIMAESEKEPSSERLETFRRHVRNPFHPFPSLSTNLLFTLPVHRLLRPRRGQPLQEHGALLRLHQGAHLVRPWQPQLPRQAVPQAPPLHQERPRQPDGLGARL